MDIHEAVKPVLREVAQEDPLTRVQRAKELFEAVRKVEADVAAIRRSGVRDLRSEGWTLKEIARELGMSWQRVRQIEIGE